MPTHICTCTPQIPYAVHQEWRTTLPRLTLSQKRRHWSRLFNDLLAWAWAHDFDVAVDMTKRTIEEQRRLVAIGAAWTLQSRHVDGLAGDLLLYKGTVYVSTSTAYEPLGRYWESLDPRNVWGGDWSFKDGGHFEYAG